MRAPSWRALGPPYSASLTAAVLGVAFLVASPMVRAQAPKSGIAPGVISLPKGPGSVQGLGESFQPDLNTGSMAYRVPIKVPAGVGKLTPELSLSYSSGGGNGEVGFGWSLGTPRIALRTEKGIPRYDGTDIFTISGVGSGELVPLGNGIYRLEVEGAYIRAQKGLDHWEVRDKSGRIYRFGTVAEARHDDATRVYAWYLTDQLDTLGNHVEYLYEKTDGVPYLRHIRYNNFSPDVVAEVTLAYEARPDVLASYRPGFKVLRSLRLAAIESRVGGSLLVRYELAYDSQSALSRLAQVTMKGTDGVTGLPPLRLDYYRFSPEADQVVTMTTPPGVSPALPDNALADLDGDGFPDLLVASAGAYECYLNDGGTSWQAREALPLSPSVALSQAGVQLADVDGDGRIDLLARLGPGVGDFRYFPAGDGFGTGTGLGFGDSVPLSNDPGFSFEDPEVRLLDVTGDGRADVVRTAEGELIVYANLGGASYAAGQVLPEIDSTMQIRFSDAAHVKLSDMNGDGLVDVVYLREDSLVYWPQRGGGLFDEAVVMEDAPTFADLQWVEVHDLNGDGLGDLVRVGVNMVEYWLNQQSGTFGARQEISGTPYRDPTSTTVHFADMNGNGSTDILWVDVTGSPDEAWRYLDVMGENRPGLLREARNGLGQVLTAEYSSSGAMSAAARREGDPWTVEQPVPTQVLARLTVSDSIGPDHVTDFVYRDGHYNGEDREFRGFGETRQLERGDTHTPTLLTSVEFDVGWLEKARKGIVLRRQLEDETGKIFRVEDASYDVVTLATGTDGRTVRAARQAWLEVTHVEGTTAPRVVLTEHEWDEHGNEIAKREWGEVVAGDPALGGDERITVSEYAVNSEDWILDRIAARQLQDASGIVLRWQRHYYDGQDYEGLPLGQVARGLLKREEIWLGPDEDRWVPKRRLAHDEHGNVVGMRDARGYDRALTYDEETHRFPVEERLSLDERDIVMRAGYDQLLGAIVRYEDPNGQAVTYRYDPLGRIEAMVHPGDSASLPTTAYEYVHGDPISAVWTRRRVQSGEPDTLDEVSYYDGQGRLRSRRQLAEASAADAWVESTAKVYDARGKESLVFRPRFVSLGEYGPPDPTEERIEEHRDALGRPIRKILPDGSETLTEHVPLGTWSYDENDTDPSSPHANTPTYKETDGLGRTMLIEEDAGGGERHRRRYTWNAADSLLAFEDAEGHVRSWRYDGMGRRVATEDPDGGSWRYRFDDESNEVARIDPLGGTLTRAHDGGGRILWETHTDTVGTERRLATYHYDEAWSGASSVGNVVGRLGWVEDEAGVKAFAYDERGRNTTEIRQVDGKSYRIERSFDAADRVTSLTYPDNSRIRYTYNARSLVDSAGGVVLSQRYGAAGELLNRELGNGVTVRRTYDARIRLSSLIAEGPAGSGVGSGRPKLQDFAYSYDRVGNVTAIADGRPGIAAEPVRDQRVTATYDALDRLVDAVGNGYTLSWTLSPSGNILTADGQLTPATPSFILGTFTYGTAGTGQPAGPHAVTRVVTGGTGGRPAGETLTYGYDAAGNLTDAAGTRLWYDGRQQVTHVEGASGDEVETGYDFAGERIRRTVRRPGGSEESTIYGGLTWEVHNGRLLKYVVIGSERVARIGNAGSYPTMRQGSLSLATPSPGSVTSSLSDLVSVAASREAAAAGTGLVVVILLIGLRTGRRRFSQSLLRGRSLHYRSSRYWPHRSLHHATQGRSYSRQTLVPMRAWVASGALVLVVWSCDTGKRGPEEIDHFPSDAVVILTDHLGSWHLLVDAQAQVVSEQAFLPYGVQRYRSGGSPSDFGYTGKQAEADTGLVAIGVRHLVVGLGRWNRPDPAYLHDPKGISSTNYADALQEYSRSNPLTLFDPDGNHPVPRKLYSLQDALNRNRPGILTQLSWGMRWTCGKCCGSDAFIYIQGQIGAKAAGIPPWASAAPGTQRWTEKFNVISGRHPGSTASLGQFSLGSKDQFTREGNKWFLQILDANGAPVKGGKVELKMFMVLKMAEGQRPDGSFTSIHHIVWLGGQRGLIIDNQRVDSWQSGIRPYTQAAAYGSKSAFLKVVAAYELPAHQTSAPAGARSTP
ncbi:MAG: toxin TcdB middle/N-terminal domain-containing protein [Polyangia bacterium]|nr:toxin TcdB middle/N-terminal domain-containing protein [Polyangia bacterium]